MLLSMYPKFELLNPVVILFLIYWRTLKSIPQKLYHFTSLTRVHNGFNFHILINMLFSFFFLLVVVILMVVRWSSWFWFFVFPLISVVEHLFTCFWAWKGKVYSSFPIKRHFISFSCSIALAITFSTLLIRSGESSHICHFSDLGKKTADFSYIWPLLCWGHSFLFLVCFLVFSSWKGVKFYQMLFLFQLKWLYFSLHFVNVFYYID